MKKLTLSLAALMACTLSFAATTYEKVTTAPTDWSGEYLLVYEADETTANVWTGVDAANCYVAATIADGKITADGLVTITIASTTTAGSYSIKVNGGTNDGKYISGKSDDNKLNFGTTASGNTLALEEDSVKITSNTSVMRYNASKNQNRFRYFKAASYSSQKAVQLYKKVAGADVPATAIALSETTLTKEQYKYVKLTATLTPAEATTEVVWSSNNEEVATVANGVVTMVGEGNAVITAKAGELTATCDVTVTAATILTCAEAAKKALAVSVNNELVADGKYVVRGYVIKEAGSIKADFTKYGNYSFWMADDKDAEQGTFKAFQVAPADGTTLVQVGDYVEVVGELTKYNTTAETAPKTGTVKVITAHETAIETVEVSDIYANNGRIENIGNGRIYTISGVDVTEMNGQLKGIYVVKMNDKAHKVVVK